MGRMDFLSLFSTRIAEASWCQQSGSISPHARQTANALMSITLPTTSYLNSIQQPFIPPLKKKMQHLFFFSQNKTHDHAASFKDHIIMLL